jgi:hypothetical protein
MVAISVEARVVLGGVRTFYFIFCVLDSLDFGLCLKSHFKANMSLKHFEKLLMYL